MTNTAVANNISGTSFAAPIVAGIAALYLQTHAHATPAQVQAAIISGATQNKLYRGVQTGGAPAALSVTAPGVPNRLAYSLLPVGDDPAVGGIVSGDPSVPANTVKVILTVISTLLW